MESMKEILASLENSIQNQEQATRQRESLKPKEPECALCGGVGFIPANLGKASLRMTECECAIAKKVLKRLPPIYVNASMIDLSQEFRDAILHWIAAPKGGGLVLTGRPGRGKTYAAAAIVKALLEIREHALYLRCFDLYTEIREAYRMDESETKIIEQYSANKYLVLDDLGSGGLSDFERRITVELFDQRANNGKITIVTTNWSVQQIAEKMDDRIASRISAFESMELTGPDRRALQR